MGRGSSRPNFARRFIRTSGGTLGLVASSSNGSPGAITRIVNRTALIPNTTGIRIRVRRRKYFHMLCRQPAGARRRAPPRPADRSYAFDQYASAQKLLSQPLWTASRRRFETAATAGRATTGMTTTFWITRSFILMNRAARLTGSISCSAALHRLSYSSLRQHVLFVRANLLSLADTSHDVNWSMKRGGSGWVMVVVYICRSV